MKKYILFDLDGTLTDSAEGIIHSVVYALEYYGIYEKDIQKLRRFIGPPLQESFIEYYGFDAQKAGEAVWKYREYFADRGMFENSGYPGIQELLEELKARSCHLFVATSKPTVYTNQILEHFGLMGYFDDVQGSNLDGSRTKKEEVIRCVLDGNGISDMGSAVMVGDRKHDVLGGRACGLDTVGVLYGFGSRGELETAGAGQIVPDVEGLGRLLLSSVC